MQFAEAAAMPLLIPSKHWFQRLLASASSSGNHVILTSVISSDSRLVTPPPPFAAAIASRGSSGPVAAAFCAELYSQLTSTRRCDAALCCARWRRPYCDLAP